jgi:hypothetical protein
MDVEHSDIKMFNKIGITIRIEKYFFYLRARLLSEPMGKAILWRVRDEGAKHSQLVQIALVVPTDATSREAEPGKFVLINKLV